MFRRARYQQLQNAEENEDNRLEFVGTSSELVSPHFYRRPSQHSIPSYNPFEQQHLHRQGAGKENASPKTPVTTGKSKSAAVTPKSGIPTDDQLTKTIGMLYFMSWTRKALKNYSNDIRKLYEIPLTERCFGTSNNDNNSTENDEESMEASTSQKAAKNIAKKLEKGYNVTETMTDLALIQKRIAEALANPQNDMLEARAETPKHLITPIEVACLSRLRTLVKMSGSWLKKTVDMEAWMEKNQKILIQHATEVSCGLEFAITAFNAVCVLGEVYGLEAVDRKSVKKDFVRYLQEYERPKLQEYNAKLEIPESVKVIEYIGKLEAKLNHHRTILHVIGSSTISIFQIILKSLPTEVLETTTRSLREVAHKLPASFRFYDDLKLSSFASSFLGSPPPNSIEYSTGEVEQHQSVSTHEASTPIYPVKSRSHSQQQHSRKNSHHSIRSDHTQQQTGAQKTTASHRSPQATVQSNSTQRSSPSNKSPPTARN